MSRVDFYGDGSPTWALGMMISAHSQSRVDLLAARQVGKTWETTLLDSANGPAPVIWSQPPGEYRDVCGEKTIRAAHPVIVFADYESWAILYVWSGSGKRVQKIWFAD